MDNERNNKKKRERKGKKAKDIDVAIDVSKEFMKVWISVWLQMSICHRNQIYKYWNLLSGDSFVKSTGVKRDDWNDVNIALFHLPDDTLNMIEKKLNDNFRKYWTPAQRVAIDESMRKFKGRWSGKVYIKSKPTKWGIKYYLMVDEVYYCSWFVLYKGAKNEDPTIKEKTRTLCNTAIDSLPKDIGAYSLYADNYYGSVGLAEDTAARGFHFTFNCKANRPSWLFGEGLIKEMGSVNGVDKMACWINKEKEIAAVYFLFSFFLFFLFLFLC